MTDSTAAAEFLRRPSLWLVAVLLGVFAIYAPSLDNRYAMDDVEIVANNQLVRELQPMAVYFSSHYWQSVGETSNLFRPVTIWSYALTHAAVGTESAAFFHHLINVLLHVLATALTFWLLRGLFVARSIAVVGAALFGVHAIHSEVVAGIVGRAELFAYVFGSVGLLAGVAFHRGRGVRRWGWLGVAWMAMFAAYGSKESSVAWLPFVGCYLLARVWRRDAAEGQARQLITAGWITLVVGLPPLVAYLVLRHVALDGLGAPPDVYWAVNPLHVVSTLTRWLTALTCWGYGLYKTLCPWWLASDYGAHVFDLRDSVLDPGFLASLAVLGGCLWAGVRYARRWPLGFLAVAVFFGFGFVTSNLPLPIGTIFAERLYYTPVLALSIVVVLGLERWADSATPRNGLLLVCAVWGAACVAVVWERNPDWRDDDALFFADVERQPRSARLHVTVAAKLGERGELGAAIQHCRDAIAIDANYAGAWINLGILQAQVGDRDSALDSLRRAGDAQHQQRADEPERLFQLARLLIEVGQPGQAVEVLVPARREWPGESWIPMALADALDQAGRRVEARALLVEVCADPNTDAQLLVQAEAKLERLR